MCRFNLPKISRIKGIFLSLLVCFCLLNAPGYAQNCPGCGDCGPVGCSAFCVACMQMNHYDTKLPIYHPSADTQVQNSTILVAPPIKSVNCADCGDDCSTGRCSPECTACGLFGSKILPPPIQKNKRIGSRKNA